MAQAAGEFELHLWMEPEDGDERDTSGAFKRKWLSGSPFIVHVSGVRASPAGSVLGGVEKYRQIALAEAAAAGTPGAPTPEQRGAGRASKAAPGGDAETPGGARIRRQSTWSPTGAEGVTVNLAAGETLGMKPQLHDEFGNASFAAEGELPALPR